MTTSDQTSAAGVEIFRFPVTGHEVRMVIRDGAPWFVASDVTNALGLTNGRMAVSRLDEDEKGVSPIDTPGGQQNLAIVSEAGLYDLIVRSDKPNAKPFRRWVTHEVLPAIRKTGRYDANPAHQIPQSFAEALQLAADQARQIEAQAAQLAIAAPKAESWDVLASADGDFSVADAAKILSRDPGIRLGRDRLFTYLHKIRWIHRQVSDNRWRVYQTAIDAGRLSEIPASHYHPRTGELVLDPPQVRVTVKGLHELHRLLGGKDPLNVPTQGAVVPASRTPTPRS